jgi:DEAD/DEAH box helicase domain-containing protein
MDHPLDGLLKAAGLVISEEIVLPGRESRYGRLPSGLHPLIARYLKTSAPKGIYSHQALALKKFLAGEDLVLGTATASGKSLIFGAAAAQALLDNPGGKVLACYPMKALANDQERKWLTLGNAVNLNVGVIHGGVATADRLGLLERSDVVLCTPDVLQSWMLGALPKTRQAMSQVRMVILDEMLEFPPLLEE